MSNTDKPQKPEGYHFDGSAKIQGMVMQTILCGCECEGDIVIRIPKRGDDKWNIEESKSFINLRAFDPQLSIYDLKVTNWIDANLNVFGYLKQTNSKTIQIIGEEFSPQLNGSIGQLKFNEEKVLVDMDYFDIFIDGDAPKIKDGLAQHGLKEGHYAELNASTYIYICS